MDFNSPLASPQPSPRSCYRNAKSIGKIYRQTMLKASYNNSLAAGLITFLVNLGIFDLSGLSDMLKLVYVTLIFAYTLGSFLIAQTWKSNRHDLMPFHAAIYFCLGGSMGMLSFVPFLGMVNLTVGQALATIGILCLNGLVVFLVVWKVYKPENFENYKTK